MQVVLLSSTKDPEKTVIAAARQCYSAGFMGDSETREKFSPSSNVELLERVLGMGHLSVLEHASFSFAIEGISRAASHQLVRHRIASYSQQSQRYVNFGETIDFVIPESIRNNEEMLRNFNYCGEVLSEFYNMMVNAGIPAEDARYIIPNAAPTKIVMSMNARELHHFFSLRCCSRAQHEIRDMANRMLAILQDAHPLLFKRAGAPCIHGKCPEGEKSCRRVTCEIR